LNDTLLSQRMSTHSGASACFHWQNHMRPTCTWEGKGYGYLEKSVWTTGHGGTLGRCSRNVGACYLPGPDPAVRINLRCPAAVDPCTRRISSSFCQKTRRICAGTAACKQLRKLCCLAL
jgi:hypothetical protein